GCPRNGRCEPQATPGALAATTPIRPSGSRTGRPFSQATDKDAMRRGIRIQPYLAPELSRKLRAYAAARSLTVSAVISAALGEYLERDEVEDALIVRRLDGVTDVVGQLKREVETLAVGFGTFAWRSFLREPAASDAVVVRQAETQYNAFLDQVAQQLRQGV